MDMDQQLTLAVEENVAWCRIVCEAHGLEERQSQSLWANLSSSPPFYPNIITRRRGSQTAVLKMITEIREKGITPGWGIKDSYADLALGAFGFRPVVEANWYSAHPPDVHAFPQQGWPRQEWTRLTGAQDLQAWEDTWNGGGPWVDKQRIFPPSLLARTSVGFWQTGMPGPIRAGFISHQSTLSVGISNWFSAEEKMSARDAAVSAAASIFPHQSLVLWSADDIRSEGVTPIGRMRVWISAE